MIIHNKLTIDGRKTDMPQDYYRHAESAENRFSHEGGAAQEGAGLAQTWYEKDIYGNMTAFNAEKPRFVLHDGPPFSNGYIHMGTSLNKILKDFIVRYKNMTGWCAEYVPGWDNMHAD